VASLVLEMHGDEDDAIGALAERRQGPDTRVTFDWTEA